MGRYTLHKGLTVMAAIALLLLAAMSVSCTPEMETGVQETAWCNVGLRLTLDELPGSKAPAGDYDDGRSDLYENYINIAGRDFRLLMFGSTAPYRLVSEIRNIEIREVESDARTSKTYILTGEAPAKVRGGSCKIVFLANWQGCGAAYPELKPGVTTIDDVERNSRFDYLADFSLGIGRGIPMFGIKDCSGLTFAEGQFTDFGRLHLLRAMAKIEVRTAVRGVPVIAASLTRACASGLAAPVGIYTQGDYVRNSYIYDYLDNIHLPAETAVRTGIPFTPQEDGSFILYVPEYDNTSASAAVSRIDLTFNAGSGPEDLQTVSDVLDFKYYDYGAAAAAGMKVGDRFDVKRNHYYIYNVRKRIDMSVDVVMDVIPYSSVELDPDFGL